MARLLTLRGIEAQFALGGAYVAVQFVINYEEGGENCILNGDDQSEWLLSEIVGKR